MKKIIAMDMSKKTVKDLADLIEANPKCSFNIDNDCWFMMNNEGEEIAESGQYSWRSQWYSHSSNYGAGIAEALVEVLNRKGFKIEASAV